MSSSSKSTTSPEVRKAQRWNVVWVVPIIAILLGAWLLYDNFAAHGPVAHIHFETAEEIYAGKTEVRCRSVKVGMVKDVKLADDLDSVVVTIELHSSSSELLRKGSRFWVVKPRLSAAEISGLGTLIQGSYIELDPGPPKSPLHDSFNGLEKPPATNSSVPGLRIELVTEQAGLLKSGALIYYRGFEVGRIEDRKLSENGEEVIYEAFISAEFSHLVCKNTRFWNTNGIEIDASSQGIMLRTPSLEAMVSGGVSFGRTAGMPVGKDINDGARFTLFSNKESATHSAFNPTLRFLLLFDQSVRGLNTSSSVEFRGIPVGNISRISHDLIDDPSDQRIPVLVEIDPNRLLPEDGTDDATEADIEFFQKEIQRGLRAGLKTTSLVTSSVHIDFDYYPNAAPANLGFAGAHTTFPTVSTGFAQMESQLASLIDKLEGLPIGETFTSVAEASAETKEMAAAARKLMEDPAFKDLPKEFKDTMASIGPRGELQGNITVTLEELRSTLKSLKAVADLLEEKPNAIIFGRGGKDDAEDEKIVPTIGPKHRN